MNSGYAMAKRMMEIEVTKVRKTGLNWTCVIPTNMYGPHDKFSTSVGHVIGGLIVKAYDESKVHLDVYGTGIALRQFLYVEDFARILMNSGRMLL